MLRVIVLACVLATAGFVACEPPPPPPDCRPTGVTTRRDVRYRRTPGVPARDQSLDLSLPVRPAGCAASPLVVYVHGGGFRAGDKAHQIADKRALFTGAGWAFASINYRLADESTGAADGRYPAAEQDVAGALAFLRSRSGPNRRSKKAQAVK